MTRIGGKTLKIMGKKNQVHSRNREGHRETCKNAQPMAYDLAPFKSAVESMQLGVTIADNMGKIIYTNPADAAMHGYEVDEIIGKDVRLFAPADFWKPLSIKDLDQVKSLSRESVNVRKDGSTFPVRLWSDVVRDEEGTPVAIVTSCEDLTENRRIEKNLSEAWNTDAAIFEQATDMVQSVGPDGTILYVNQGWIGTLGYDRKEAMGMNMLDIVSEEQQFHCRTMLENVLSGEKIDGVETVFVTKAGRHIDVEGSVSTRSMDGHAVSTLGIFRDITTRKRAVEELKRAQSNLEVRIRERTDELTQTVALLQEQISMREQAEEELDEFNRRFALAAEGSNDGLWNWDFETQQVFLSPRWKAILGYEDEEIGCEEEEWFRRIYSSDLDRVKAEITSHLEGKTPHLESEHRLLHKDGRYRWILCRGTAARNMDGKPYCMAGSLTDMTERKKAHEQLKEKTFYDYLTNLPNRAYYTEQLKQAVKGSKRRSSRMFAVLSLDIDRFKLYNDSLGHVSADQLLRSIAARLGREIRPGDIVARTGGDEFAILLNDIGDECDALNVAERVQGSLQKPILIGDNEIFISMSIGIACSRLNFHEAEDLLRCSEMAMWEVKSKGGSGYMVYTPELHKDTASYLKLETDLRRAIDLGELVNYFQPVVELKSGKITGFESLLRWNHSEMGLVSPAEFIPIAEQTGLIIPIGQWVLTEASRTAMSWNGVCSGRAPMTVSVNLSSKQFDKGEVVMQVERALEESGLDPSRMVVEITETMIMESPESSAEMLSRIKELGVRTAMDDFGTGYSSLSLLNTLPLDVLKIDRSFIGKMERGNEHTSIVTAIVTMARSLGLEIVAEGVETLEQWQILMGLGCQYAQGFYFSRPLEPAAAAQLLSAPLPWEFDPSKKASRG